MYTHTHTHTQEDEQTEPSAYGDEQRCDMLMSYGQELDDQNGLNDYDFVLVMPWDFRNKPRSWVEKRRSSQQEVIQALRKEHLVCRVLKSRDEDELLVLVRAPTYEEFCLVQGKRDKPKAPDLSAAAKALPVVSPPIMDWCSFWADKLAIEYQVREVQEGFRGCTLPFSFAKRVLFVREGEFNAPNSIKPKRVEMSNRLPGQKKGSKELIRVENLMRRLGSNFTEWDGSIAAYRVENNFLKTMYGLRGTKSFSDWKTEKVRQGQMQATAKRQELIRKVMDLALKRRLRETWFCRENVLKRNWAELANHRVVSAVVPLHHPSSRKWLEENWVKVGSASLASLTAASPVHDLRAYFGEEVAFYYAFVEFYNTWLVGPAFFGSIIFVYQVAEAPDTLDSDALISYMILISVWATLFLEMWSRQQNNLAQMWGVLHIGTEDSVRTEFVGELRYNHWVGDLDSREKLDSLWQRNFGIPFLILSLGCLFVFQVMMALNKSEFKNDQGGGGGFIPAGAISIGEGSFPLFLPCMSCSCGDALARVLVARGWQVARNVMLHA